MENSRLKSLFHVPDTRGETDYTMGRLVRLENSGEISKLIMEKVILTLIERKIPPLHELLVNLPLLY